MKAKEFEAHLTNQLIPFWNRLKDDKCGGFYGLVTQDLQVDTKSSKGVILNSRILWFYSKAYMTLKDSTLLQMADHAFEFLAEHCYDRQFGGIYWSLQYDGTPEDTTKHTYNQAFAVYALSIYYQACHKKEALNLAYTLYDLIEDKCRDEDGYLEAFHQDFTPASNEKLSENGVMAERTMNTLLHVMEAYTELYRADASPKVKDNLYEILQLFSEKIYNPDKKILDVFFDRNYRTLIDLESFGHDIEASWLIDRACDVLGDAEWQATMSEITAALAEVTYEHAYDTTFHALNNERENATVDRQKIWWVQAEAVIGFYNTYKNHPERQEYRTASEDIWKFICQHVVDANSGEWFESLDANGKPNREQALVHPWKCPYHNGRMCMEMMERLS